MNIQIFGTAKSADTRKAQRYFKERNIRFQFIDMRQKGMSRGEFDSVLRAVGGVDIMLDIDAKDTEAVSLIRYIYDKEDKLYENQQVIKLPVVRNGRQATVGYQPDVWKGWQ